MKLVKKIISLFLVLTILSGLSIGFTSCSNSKKILTVGEYLTELTDKFGIYTYKSDEPYLENVSAKNQYFGAVQMAYEWNIIDESTYLDLDSVVDKGFAANTLVKAVGLADTSGASYDDIAQFAADNGYVTFDYRGRTDNAREITAEEARDSMEASFKIWTDRDYGEGTAVVEWKENVTDFSTLGENDVYQLENGKIGISRKVYDDLVAGTSSANGGTAEEGIATLQKGDSFVLPAAVTETQTITPYIAKDVQMTDDFVVITPEEATEEQVEAMYENFESQGSMDVDLTQALITDGAGNVVRRPATAQNMSNEAEAQVGFIGSDVSGATSSSCNDVELIDFDVDGLHITGTASKDGVKFNVDGTLSKTQKGEMKFNKSYEVKDFHVDHDIQNKWTKIEKAYLNVEYTTVDTTHLDFSYKKTGTFAPEHTNGNGKFPSNFSRAILKDSEAKGAKNIKICNIEFAGSPFLSLRLIVELQIEVNGYVTLTVTTTNGKGFDYNKGSGIRFINETKETTNLEAHAQAELSLYIGIGAFMFGTSLNIVGGGFRFTIGVIVDVTARMIDSERRLYSVEQLPSCNSDIAESICGDMEGVKYVHELYGEVTLSCEICADLKTYWKVWVGLDPNSKVADVLGKADIELGTEWGGPENGVIDALCFHIEDGNRVDACTRQYSNVEASTTEPPTTEEYTGTNIIKIENYYVNVKPGSSEKIELGHIPDGYSEADLVYESSDPDIASVSSNGKVTGKSEGSAIITISTKDNKFTATCNVLVTETKGGGSSGGAGSSGDF